MDREERLHALRRWRAETRRDAGLGEQLGEEGDARVILGLGGDLEAGARELAGKIIQALSAAMTPKARVAYDRDVRAWTQLNRCHDEVRAAALWLFRKDTQKEQRFPSLFAAGRPNGGRPKKQADELAPSAAADDDVTKPPVK